MNHPTVKQGMRMWHTVAMVILCAAQLAPMAGAAGAGMVTVTEYQVGGVPKFLTASSEEVRALDANPAYGKNEPPSFLARTGVEFKAFDAAETGTVPVCRFYQASIGVHPSHFYTAFADECDALKRNPDWVYEGVAFHALPASPEGACAAGSTPMYRRFAVNRNGPVDLPPRAWSPLHVFSPSSKWRSVADGYWSREGLGPDGVAFCVPAFHDVATEQSAEIVRSGWDILIDDPWFVGGALAVSVVRGDPGGWYQYSEPFEDALGIAGYLGIANVPGAGTTQVQGAAGWAPYAGKALFHFVVGPDSYASPTYLLSVDRVAADTIEGCAHRHYDYGMGPTEAVTTCLPFKGVRRP
jgi:hypothetical protein